MKRKEASTGKKAESAKETGVGKSGKPNKLINETSTYLQQHAYNPVEWYPWGEEALKRAKSEDKPVLLSIGYAACHWCHVMEHESFEDKETAKLMNENFVNIKVDREERTDLDEIYMKAVQMMTGHGGWPMTVFLTPDMKPFYGGTYFPPEDRHGLPSFKRLLAGVIDAFKNQRTEVEESSADITKHIRLLDQLAVNSYEENDVEAALKEYINYERIEAAIVPLINHFDTQFGGFGNAPKFPHTMSIALAMRCSLPDTTLAGSRKEQSLELVSTSLDKMAYGGIQDQIGGGFARYSVDRRWLVPHFEKMLYDNALLCQVYLEGYSLLKRKYWLDVADGILEFVLRELTTADGAFYSSLDADSEGEEGKFYVWRPEDISDLLGSSDGQWVNEVYGVSAMGNFEHGTSVLHLSKSPEKLSEKYEITEEQFWSRLNPLRKRLLEERAKRVRPGRDEKVLTSWNSLMISAFVEGYRTIKKDLYLETAKRAARFILDNLMEGGRLLRTWGAGKAKLNGYLDDYACTAQAMLDLASVDADPVWFKTALSLAEYLLEHFLDEDGGLFYTSDDHEALVVRPKSHFDGSVPSGTSVAAFVLLRLWKLTGDSTFMKRAQELFAVYGQHLIKMPDQFANLLCAADFYLSEGPEIALIINEKDNGWKEMLSAINESYSPNKVVLVGTEKSASQKNSPALLKDRKLVDGKPTVYVCRNFTCSKPVTDIEELKKVLADLPRK